MAAGHAATDDLDDLAQLDAHGHFHEAGVGDLAGESKDLGPLAALRAHVEEPLAAVAHDGRDIGVGLHVVDQRRLAPEAACRRIRRPRLGRAPLAFNRCDQRRLLAANKRARAKPNLHIEIERRIADVVAQQAVASRFPQRGRQPRDCHRILRANIDEPFARANRVSRDRHSLDHAMRIALHHAAIHERAGVAFVAVADHIFHVARGLGYCAPLQSRGIPAAAAPAQSALRDAMNHAVGRHLCQHCQKRLVAIAGDVVVNLLRVDVARILQHNPHLLVEVIVQLALQFRRWRAAQAFYDRLGVACIHVVVEGFFRVHAHQRPVRARPHASCAPHQHRLS